MSDCPEESGETFCSLPQQSSRFTHVTPSLESVMLLSTAVQNERSVRLRYRSTRGVVTERLFHPHGVVAHEGVWYTIGYCHLRQAQRLFRLDRVQRF